MVKLKPGILVALKASVQGGVTYERHDLGRQEGAHNSEQSEWKTKRYVEDAKEHKAAVTAVRHARACIENACTKTPWGYIYVGATSEELHQRIDQAHEIETTFNAAARYSTVSVSIYLGQVAENDEEALKAVQQEFAAIMVELEAAAKKGNVKSMRDLCYRATAMKRLLEENTDAEGAAREAIKGARKLARNIVKLVEKEGAALETVLTDEAMESVSTARFFFAPRLDNAVIAEEGAA